MQLLGTARGVGHGMDAAQHLQLLGAEALRAQGNPIDAHGRIFRETAALDGAGIGFQGDFDVGGKTELGAGLIQHATDRRG